MSIFAAVIGTGVAWSQGLAPAITHGLRSEKKIALTFDACFGPTAGYDRAAIDALLETGTEATLFLSGAWVKKFPDETRFLSAQKQFELAAHGYEHLDLTEQNDTVLRAEIRQTQDLFFELLGFRPALFRAPFARIDDRVLEVAAREHLRVIQYEVSSGDSDRHLKADDIVRDLLARARRGSIVIFHMNGHGRETAAILRVLIPQYRKRGYALVKVSALIAPS